MGPDMYVPGFTLTLSEPQALPPEEADLETLELMGIENQVHGFP